MYLPKYKIIFPLLVLLFSIISVGNTEATAKKTIETENFMIHFPEKYIDYAQKVAEAAEWSHQKLVPDFTYSPREKTHVAILDDSDLAGGFADPTLYNRIGIYPNTPVNYSYSSGLSAHGTNWTTLLTLHEYSHILHLDLNTGLAADLRSIFGRIPGATTPHLLQSYALIEGIAVWQESNKTGAGRGNNSFYPMFINALLDNDLLLQGDQILGRYSISGWQPGTPYYFYGYLLVDYLISEYGENKFYDLLYYLADHPKYLDKGLTKIYNRNFTRLWDDLIQSLQANRDIQKKYLNDGFSENKYLPTQGEIQRNPRISPNGEYLAYFASGEIIESIRLLNLRTGEDNHLTAGVFGDDSKLTWSDDNTILYTKLNRDNRNALRYDVYKYNRINNAEERLTKNQRIYGIEYINDNEFIYMQRNNEQTNLGIWNGHTWTSYSSVEGVDFAHVDGHYTNDLIISIIDSQGYSNLYNISLNGNNEINKKPITQDSASQGNPTLTPDGRYIFFDANYDDKFDIYCLDRKTGEFYQVTDTLYGAFSPEISPDGKDIIIMNYTVDGYKLVKIPFQKSNWEKVSVGFEELLNPKVNKSVEMKVKDYSPWESMRPRFVIPVIEGDEQLWTGFYTSGKDAFDLHQYSIQAGHGWEAKSFDFNINYKKKWDTVHQPTIALNLKNHTEYLDKKWKNQNKFKLTSYLSFGDVWQSIQPGIELQRTTRSIENPIEGKLFMNYRDMQGKDYYKQNRNLTASIYKELNTSERYTSTIARWDEQWSIVNHGQLNLQATVGRSQNPKAFTVGGLDDKFAIRGYNNTQRQNATAFSFQYKYPIIRLERGLADKPVFLQDINVGMYLDRGFFDREVWQSIGFELEADIILAYGNSSFSPKIGVAWTKATDKPVWYMRMGIGSFYF